MTIICEFCHRPITDPSGYCTDECEDNELSSPPEPDTHGDPDQYWDDRCEPDIY
jgi:hypothetical protein